MMLISCHQTHLRWTASVTTGIVPAVSQLLIRWEATLISLYPGLAMVLAEYRNNFTRLCVADWTTKVTTTQGYLQGVEVPIWWHLGQELQLKRSRPS